MILFLRNFWPALVWTVVIFVLTLLPGNYIPKVGSFWSLFSPDKLIHLFLFGVFAFAMLWSMSRKRGDTNQKLWFLIIKTLAFALALAVFTEILQALLPIGRNGNLYDGIADVFGAGLGSLIFLFSKKKRIVPVSDL